MQASICQDMPMHSRKRRGLSTIIAGIFIIAVAIAGVNTIMYAMNQYDTYNKALSEKTSKDLNKLNEKFELVDLKIDSNKFNMTMRNTGSVAVGLIRLWVTNQTNGWYNNYTLTDVIAPGATRAGIGQTITGLVATNSSSYQLKVVTDRGNAGVYNLASASTQNLKLQLFVLPRSIPSGQNVTVLFGVTNSLTDGSIVQSATPKVPLSFTTTEASSGTTTADAILMEGPTPAAGDSLRQGQTAFFKWVYKIVGDKGDRLNFNATIVGAKQGNYVVDTAEVVVDQLAEQSGVALQATGITITQDDESGTLHLHKENVDVPNALLAGHHAEPSFADQTATTTATLNLATPSVWFLSKNSTDITVNSGNWNLTMYYKTGPGAGSHNINVKYEIWDSTNTVLKSTILNFNLTPPTSSTYVKYNPTPMQSTSSNIVLDTGDRLRITLTYTAPGPDFILRYDETGFDGFLKTPTTTPSWPLYQTYSGGNVEVIMKNTGPSPIWVDQSSRVVFTHSSNGLNYAGLITSWKDISGSPSGAIDSTHDSLVMAPGTKFKLVFTEACKTPTTSACAAGDSAKNNKGNYDVAVRVSGYDKDGGFVLRVVKIGIVVV